MDKENNPQKSGSENSQPLRRKYPRYYNSESDLEQFIGAKNLLLDFTPTTKQVKIFNPEDSEEFWCTPDVKSINNVLLVKRFSSGFDFVHLMRLNAKTASTKFKFPASFIGTLISKLSEIMLKLEVMPDGTIILPGSTFPTTREELSKDAFWSGENCVKLCTFYMKPYMSEYGSLMFRLHIRVPERSFRTFTENGATTAWMGPASSISLSVAEGFLKVLKEIQ